MLVSFVLLSNKALLTTLTIAVHTSMLDKTVQLSPPPSPSRVITLPSLLPRLADHFDAWPILIVQNLLCVCICEFHESSAGSDIGQNAPGAICGQVSWGRKYVDNIAFYKWHNKAWISNTHTNRSELPNVKDLSNLPLIWVSLNLWVHQSLKLKTNASLDRSEVTPCGLSHRLCAKISINLSTELTLINALT